MKKFIKNFWVIFLSLIIIVGCESTQKTEKVKYDGDKIIYELSEEITTKINKNGGEIEVAQNQVFVSIDKSSKTKKYESGQHKIEKETNYRYFYVNKEKISAQKIKFGTTEPAIFKDNRDGNLKYNFYGEFDYEITDIEYLIKNYCENNENNLDEYIPKILKDEIIKVINNSNFSNFNYLTISVNEIKTDVINNINTKKTGIKIDNLTIMSISQVK